MELVLNLFFLAPKAKIFPHTTLSGINLFTVMIQVMGSPKIVENRGKESNFPSQQLYTMPSKHSCFFFFNPSPPPLTQEPFIILSREHAEGLVCATPE